MDKVKKIALRTLQIFLDTKMLVFSGNATLFIITALFPMLMLIISIVNLLPGYSPESVAEVFFHLLPNLESMRELVESMVTNLRDQSGGLLASIAAVTTLWAASGGVNAIRVGLNQLDGDEPGKRLHNLLLKRVVFTLLVVILIPAFLVFNMLGSSVQHVMDNIIAKLGAEKLLLWRDSIASVFQIGTLVVPIAALLFVLLIYRFLPAKRHTLKSRIPGTIFTGVGSFLFTQLFSFFIPRFYRSSSLYGSLASLFLALLWIRFIMMILFAGGALNTALEEENAKPVEEKEEAYTDYFRGE